jgi:hypothetical protein
MDVMDMAKDPKFHACMKHIDICYNSIHEVVEDEKLEYIPREENITDILMKLLMPKPFKDQTTQTLENQLLVNTV